MYWLATRSGAELELRFQSRLRSLYNLWSYVRREKNPTAHACTVATPIIAVSVTGPVHSESVCQLPSKLQIGGQSSMCK